VVQTKGHPSNIRNLSKGNKNELIVFAEIHCETQLRRKSSKVRINGLTKVFVLQALLQNHRLHKIKSSFINLDKNNDVSATYLSKIHD